MSEPKLISPLLDGFIMGNPMSDRQGVQCCPAMSQNGEKRYIVKIISIPASQVQLEALLLTGAYPSQEAALSYFKDLADRTVGEIHILKKLASLEGFLPFDGWQLVEKENEPGYQIYVLSPYKRSLARHFRRHTMTHLNAVNLGLDLCASLAVCRRAGYLYVDLKPENVFVSEDGEFRIGDLGFVSLNSLQFTSLDERYHSAYSAPECADMLASLNGTVDTYAAGMILYQTYNDGKLPQVAPGEQLPPPEYADYEMAEIILKAIDPDPDKRWKDPIAMGHAIVAYMQKNGANDVPIVPAAPVVAEPVAEEPVVEEPELQEEDPMKATASLEAVEDTADAASQDAEDVSQDDLLADVERLLGEEPEPALEEATDAVPEEDPVPEPEEEASPAMDADDPASLAFLQELVSDETAPSEELAPEVSYEELSSDTSDILSQADELISHETPGGVIAPEPIEIPIPEPIVIKVAEPAPEIGVIEAGVPTQAEDGEDYDDEDYYDDDEPSSFSWKKLIIVLLIALLLGSACFGGYVYYKEYYLQTISSLAVTGQDNALTVQIVSDIDESLLTVVCTDTYGITRTSKVSNGSASFTDLNANTIYNISVEIDGFHKLLGPTTSSYTTPKITTIISFTAIAGTEEGSANLRFKVDGPKADSWKVVYSTEGEEEHTLDFTDSTVTVTGLTIGKTYTFQLKTDTPLYIVGNDTLQYTALALVEAKDLQITGCADGKLTAQWAVPEGKTVNSWSVRCYSDGGYDESITTSETFVEFTGLDTTKAYTIEVIAEGMTIAQREYVTANSVTITGHQQDTSDPSKLILNWDYTGTAPEGEWLVLYSIDNSTETEVVRTTTNSAVIPHMVPNATYSFTIQTQAGVTLFGSEFQVETPAAPTFNKYTVATNNMTFTMCQTPDKENWEHKDITNFTHIFALGQKASFKVVVNKVYDTSPDQITTMFVIRDSEGNLISKDCTVSSWTAMWYQRRCELDVPQLPQVPGNYTMEIYFNGCIVHNQQFSIAA